MRGMAAKLKELLVGDKAPDFSAADETGRTWSLKALKGKTVVLYFYPKDSTPGCTVEACDFRDRYDAFVKKGARIRRGQGDLPRVRRVGEEDPLRPGVHGRHSFDLRHRPERQDRLG
jgi:hypothetical protein